MKVKLEKNEN